MITYKINVLDALKEKGFSSYKIRNDKIIGQAELSKIRHNELCSKGTLDTLCRLLGCQVGDILIYIPDNQN